jgi:cysteine desulfurase/selenocysteine lyase
MQKVIKNLKNDFPILQNNKDIVYLDTTATAQKPSFVINAIKEYLENDYSNIHRGAYNIAEKSEQMYVESKKKIAGFLNVKNWREIIYSFNSTYASNLLV